MKNNLYRSFCEIFYYQIKHLQVVRALSGDGYGQQYADQIKYGAVICSTFTDFGDLSFPTEIL